MAAALEEIGPEAARALLAGPGAPRLIDCREQEEWEICHLKGAVLLPLTVFSERYEAVLRDPAEPLIVYCHHGVRSQHAADWLAARGYTQVRSLAGGIDAWSQVIDAGVARY